MGYIGAGISRFNTVNGLSVNADGPTVTGIKDEDNMASNSAVKLATQQSIKAYVDSQIGANNELSEVLANGSTTGGNDISFGDADRAYFGAGNDLEIFSDGTTSYIKENGSGDLRIWADNPNIATAGGNKIFYGNNGVAELYYTGGVKRLETTSGGIDVTGTVTADGLTVSGATEFQDNPVISNSSPELTFETTSATHTNWQIAAQESLSQAFEISSGQVDADASDDTWTKRFTVKNDGDISFYDSSGSSQSLFWDASTQRLGLGTAAPTNPLHISSSAGEAVLISNSNASGNSQIKLDGATDFQIGTGQASSGFANKFFLYDATNAATRMVVDNSGNLGIATASPSDKLEINGNARLNPTSNPVLRFAENGTVRGLITSSSTIGLSLEAQSTLPFRVNTNGSERMRVDSSGNVNIYGTDNRPLAITSFNTVSAGAGWDLDATSGNGVVSISTGGTERMRVDSSGRLGLGVTNPVNKLSLPNNNYIAWKNNAGSSETIAIRANTSDGLEFLTGSTRMTITSGGSVGIGTALPTADLHISYGSGSGLLVEDTTNSPSVKSVVTSGNTESYFGATSNHPLVFLQNNTERMRVDTSGRFGVGKVPDSNFNIGCELDPNGFLIASRASNIAAYFNRNTDGAVVWFGRSSSNVGDITVATTGTTYNTTSDIRLKTDIAPISDATDKLMAMNAVTHRWKADPDADAVHGFIAQEMAEIIPEAVSGDPDGEKMMAMDYGRITPVIVAALQEANKKIAELETRIKELETK